MHPLKQLVHNSDLMNSLAKEYGTPLYIYDASRIRENVNIIKNSLEKYFDKFHICYAIKSNSNPHLIKIMLDTFPEMGGDCSSPGEIYAAELSGIELSNCIYTGNYESKADLSKALEKGCNINLDDTTSLDRLKTIGLPERISFRLNPGFGKGTFSQITTAGRKAKFGIPTEKITDAYQKAINLGIKNFGMQCMVGSGNLDEEHFFDVINQTRKLNPNTTIEVLTPDFLRKGDAYKKVLDAKPDVFNHNIETVPSLYLKVRPGSRYFASLELLKNAKKVNKNIFTKSGIMVGLGETRDEILQVMDDLRAADVDFITIGQYLQPSTKHYPLDRYYTPKEFKDLGTIAKAKGFLLVSSSPLTRSSYHADEDFAKLQQNRLKNN